MTPLSKKILLSIFLGVIVINFSYALTYRIKPMVDAEAYNEIAVNILNHEEYRATLTGPLNLDSAISRIGPGYELFLATDYLLFGRNLWVIWLLQATLYALTVIMLGILTARYFSIRPAVLYGVMILFGALIDIVQLNAMLMTESLFLFLLTLSFFYFSKINQDENIKIYQWILLGLLLGLLTLTRPTGLIIFILFAAVSLYKYRLKGKAWLAITLMALAFVVIQLPWFIRNYQVYHQFIFHSVAGGLNVFSGNYPGNHGEFNSNFPLYKEYVQKYISPVELNTAAKTWYRDFAFHHPFAAIGILIEKAAIFFSLAKTSGFWFHYFGKIDQLGTVLVSALENCIILGSQILFWIIVIKKWFAKEFNKKELFYVLAAGALAITPILSVVSNRHRLPLVIVSLPIVAFTIDLLIKNYSTMWRQIAIAVIILIIASSLDVYLQFNKFKAHINTVSTLEINPTHA